MFGSWPPASFKKLSPEVQTNFWREAKELAGKDHLEELFVQALTKSRIEQEISQVGGEYLPLSVYASRGFNTADIESNAKSLKSIVYSADAIASTFTLCAPSHSRSSLARRSMS